MAIDMEQLKADKEKKILSDLDTRKMEDAWKRVLPEYTPRDSQKHVMQWIDEQPAHVKYIMAEMPVGCHAKDTPIIMFDGTRKKVQDVAVGDLLLGPDSNSREVLQLHRGRQLMYEIVPIKGDPFVVNEDHILSLRTTPRGSRYHKSFSGKEIINISVKDFLEKSNDFKKNVKLYRPECIHFNNVNTLDIDPYFLGVLLGDGCLVKGVSVTTIDAPIKETVLEQASLFDLKIRKKNKEGTEAIGYFLSSSRGGLSTRNKLINILKDMDLYGKKSHNKFIPLQYKTSSKESRLQILAGLIDTDGYYGNNIYCYTTKSKQLANDVKFIVRSLGLAATSSIKTVNENEYVNVTISGHIDIIPVKLQRKQASIRKQKKNVLVTGFSINPLDVDDYYGFTLNKDHLYLLNDFTVTHNCGKSPLAIAFSSYINNGRGSSFILTPQKTLQRQYEKSFEKEILASVYGRNNYTCDYKNTTCDNGSEIKPKCDDCPADAAREIAMSSPNMVLNYSIALTYFKYLRTKIPPRDVMIFDECHTLESHLVEFSSLNVSKNTCKKYGVKYHRPKNTADALEWIMNTYLPAIMDKLSEYRKHINEMDMSFGNKVTKYDIKVIKGYKAGVEHRDTINDILMTDPKFFDNKYVLISDYDSFKFKEVFGKNNFRNLCLPKANRFLFLSSTILDKEGFCNDLGIDSSEAAFISVDSEFNVDNREVVYKPITKMNFGWDKPDRKSETDKMLRAINHICKFHKDQSGIIHTGSFKIAEWIMDNLDTTHEVVHHNPSKKKDEKVIRDDVIDYYLENASTKPMLLISPSITEGMDLMDDLGRFAIIAKVPYPFLGDAWVKRRMQISKDWYNRQAITGIIQGCGRIVRSKDDWGQVYILDESFNFLYNQTKGMIPKWWKDGLIVL
jgi:hypothetical protein